MMDRKELETRCFRNLRFIAVIGALLILADLCFSFLGQDVIIERDGGTIYLIRPAAGESPGHVALDAEVRTADGTLTQHFDVRIDPQRSSADTGSAKEDAPEPSSGADQLRSELRAISSVFNEDLSRRRIVLPAALSGGESIRWSLARSTNTLLLILMTGMLMFLVWRNRLRPLQRLERARRRSVLRSLPGFISQLTLLLNAGMVLSSAFEVAVEHTTDGKAEDTGGKNETDYYQRRIRSIYHSMKNANGSLHRELQSFAEESGVTDFMRISGIISDNINKGAELTEKLERESDSLWQSRKLRAERQGQAAETKMTIPLAIFLLVLIIITVSPALLQL